MCTAPSMCPPSHSAWERTSMTMRPWMVVGSALVAADAPLAVISRRSRSVMRVFMRECADDARARFAVDRQSHDRELRQAMDSNGFWPVSTLHQDLSVEGTARRRGVRDEGLPERRHHAGGHGGGPNRAEGDSALGRGLLGVVHKR